MKQLGKVLNKTSWAQASNTINTNSESVFSAVTMLENAAFKHKGYFLTSEEVEQLYPSAEEGSQAFVYNSSNPSTAPYDIYQMIGGTWVDTGLNGGSVSVDLTKKQDTLVGYSESVSGGKATQVAIQGDTIALSGKVSLGNVDNMESAILMSSSQAGAAIAKANTLEQSMNAIKSPIKPIQLNSQGKLELNIGKGLYVEDGKLCTTGASGGGGGGTTLSEGDGIRIYNDTINVEYDIDTLRVNSCGGLTVNYGDGLTIKDGKLSALTAVNAGKGLVKKGDALQVSVGTGLLVADDVYVNMGKGLATDNENKVNVNLDEQTLTTDACGKVIVNKDSLIGNGLKKEYNKFAVNYGTGLALSNKAIVVNYGAGLDIQGGKLVSTVQGGKTYMGGDGISINGDKIAVKYGSGLTTNTCGRMIVDAANLTVKYADYAYYAPTSCSAQYASYAESADHATVSCSANYANSAGKATSDINGNAIHDTYISKSLVGKEGIEIRDGSLSISTGKGINVVCDKVVVHNGNGITFNSEGKLTLSLHEKSGLNITSEGLSVNVGVALGTSDGKLNVLYGTGLGKSTDNKLQVLLGTGLAVEGNYIRVEEAVYDSIEEANAGVSRAHEVVTKLQTALGGKQNTLTLATGLEWGNTDMIQVKMNAPLSYDEGGRLKLDYDETLTVSGNKLGVDTSKIAGAGIDLDSDYKMLTIGTKAAKELAGTGLVADGPKIKVKYSSGLTTNTCGNLIVDAANLTVGNASKLQGYAATDIDRAISMDRSKVIDLTALQDDKWYPCTLQLGVKQLTNIRIWNCLTSESIPSWSTHRYGFSLQVVWEVTANGWSAQEAARKIHMSQYKFANANPCGGITQNTSASVEIVWLRGGAKYLYHTNNGENFVVHADGYSWEGSGSSFTAAVRTASQVTNPIYGYSGTGSQSSVSEMYADAFHGLADKATADANGNNIANTYQTKIRTTYGLEMTGGATIGMPLLGAMLANGAVDGIKNNKQRVLELSCGAIQIKLSTGLAIDDNGYLYVQDKYVTK